MDCCPYLGIIEFNFTFYKFVKVDGFVETYSTMKRMKGMKKRITANQSFNFMFFMPFMVSVVFLQCHHISPQQKRNI